MSEGHVSLDNELRLIKAALLYADSVVLFSPTAQILDDVAALGEASQADRLNVLIETAPMLGRAEEAEQLVHMYRSVNLMKNEKQRVLKRMELDHLLDQAWVPLQASVDRMLAEAGMQELLLAVDEGLLEVRQIGRGFPESATISIYDDMAASFAASLTDILTQHSAYPLFDSGSAELAAAMVRDGLIVPNAIQNRHGVDAASAASYIERLPTFESATMQEVIDARASLSRPLQRFRSAVRQVGATFESQPYSIELQREIDDAWDLTVDPELQELREDLRNASYTRLLGRRASRSMSGLTATGLIVGSMMMGQIPDMMAMLGAASLLTGAAYDRIDELEELKRQRFFFLHAAEQALDE
ncbi:MAG: hypothetical protein GXP36_09755 [Actinobacteria bacterium]|nr:hypothetical protein [Actinomycetota bacterium]